MKQKIFLSAALCILLQVPLFAKGTVAFVPVHRGLWRVSDDGKATRTPFRFPQAQMGAGTEAKLSPNNQQLAFVRGPNIWLLRLPSMECVQLTAFPEWDLKENGAQSTAIYGWTKDGQRLLIETVFADWSGEGGVPEALTITPLDQCSKVISREPAKLVDGAGKYFLETTSPKLERTEDWPSLHPDSFSSAPAGAPSPDGKRTASVHDVDLLVDGKAIAAGISPYRFWWISPRALAVISLKSKTEFELKIVTVPGGKIFGPFIEK